MAIYDSGILESHFLPEEISQRNFSAGETVFHQGAVAQMIYFVVSGEVRVETYLEDGRSIVFYRARAGAALCEENPLLPQSLYTGLASVDSVLRGVSRTTMIVKMRQSWEFAQALNQCLAQRYASALMARELIAVKSAEDRLLMWLHWQSTWGATPVDLEGRMGSIGPDLSLSRESIYRAFARLEQEGKIRREGGHIILLGVKKSTAE